MSVSLTKVREELSRAHAATKRAREKAGEVMETVLDAGITGGTGYVLGVWEGRIAKKEQYELLGVPAPLAIALAGHAAALFGVGRGMEKHFRSVGNGGLTIHLNGLGRGQGQQWRAQHPDNPGLMGDESAGVLPTARRAVGISASELASAAL